MKRIKMTVIIQFSDFISGPDSVLPKDLVRRTKKTLRTGLERVGWLILFVFNLVQWKDEFWKISDSDMNPLLGLRHVTEVKELRVKYK